MTTAKERRRLYKAWGLQPRDDVERRRYADFINAQVNVERIRGELLEARLILDDATRALDRREALMVREVPPPPSEGSARLQAASLMDRVRKRTDAFFEAMKPKPAKPRSWRHRLARWFAGVDDEEPL